jgi:hypothetical protein
MQKARRRGKPKKAPLRPLVDARFQVLFHSPTRGASHLSLTVLVHYRSSAVFSLPGWAPGIQAGLHVTRPTQGTDGRKRTLARKGVSPATPRLSSTLPVRDKTDHKSDPTTPRGPKAARFRLHPRSLATTGGIDNFFLLLRVLRCFSSPGKPRHKNRCAAKNRAGCPIRTRPDQPLFAGTRTFSQLTASFIACGSQGILRTPLIRFS